MLGDAESQAQLLRGLLPVADDVTVRSHLHGVPFVVSGVPEVEVVMMDAHAHEVARAGLLVHGHQAIGVPFLGLPERDDILVTQLRGMTVMLEVILVLRMSLDVEMPGVPVAEHGHGLRPPVSPDAQFRVTKPVRILILLERLKTGLERTLGDCRSIGVLWRSRERSGGHVTAEPDNQYRPGQETA